MYVFLTILPALLLLCCIGGCGRRHTVVRQAFYFWKSSDWYIGDEEQAMMERLKTGKLYVKFFEVAAQGPLGPVPEAKTALHKYHGDPDSGRRNDPEIVPVIFINNSALTGLSTGGADSLADNILFLTGKYFKRLEAGSQPWRELQIDCDWLASNKDIYFRLLRALKQRSGRVISCTLRLYPYKYRDKMGVPPADRAMLMCYNLLNPLTADDENSILSTPQLKGYLGRRNPYPLPFDVALPLYDRMQWYQHDQFKDVIHTDTSRLSGILRPLKPYWYEVLQDTVLDGDFLRAGDQIKYESVSPAVLRESAALLKAAVPLGDTTTIAFFHLDAKLLQQFGYATLDSLSASFGR